MARYGEPMIRTIGWSLRSFSALASLSLLAGTLAACGAAPAPAVASATEAPKDTAASAAPAPAPAPVSEAIVAPPSAAPASSGPRVIGYFTNWAHERTGACAFKTEDVDPSLFTHINYAFALIGPGKNKQGDEGSPTYELITSHADDTKRLYGEVNALKQKNPKLKTFLSVGGWAFNDPPTAWIFSAMARTPETRGHFIRHAISFLRTHGFDGLDIDWEFPGAPERGGKPEDTQNFTLLLREFRAQMHAEAVESGKPELLLTIASPAGQQNFSRIELSQIHESLDWINVMTYDYNGDWTLVTGANAPIRDEGGPNIDTTITAYLAAGIPADKLVFGVPTYARGWGGVTEAKPKATATTKGPNGECGEGSLGSHQVAAWVKSGSYLGKWDAVSETPFAYSKKDKNWVSYEDTRSIDAKLRYMKSKSLGGAMFWAIDLDDFKNGYPIISRVSKALLSAPAKEPAAKEPAKAAPAAAPAAAKTEPAKTEPAKTEPAKK